MRKQALNARRAFKIGKVGYLVVVFLRNVQRGGKLSERAIKSDSPNVVAHLESYVKFNVTLRRAQPVQDRPRRFIFSA